MRIVVIGSMTNAQKARRMLSSHGIRAHLTKTDSTTHGNGCVYGLEIADGDLYNACNTLRAGGVEYRVL